MQAVLGFGIVGVCRGDELTNLKCSYVRDIGEEIVVQIPTTKSKVPKMNVIGGEFTNIIRRYIALRPANATTDRFFLQYRNGKCINQVIGKNCIAKFPKDIATFLGLDDPESYTGHSYRRTGTTIAANNGANLEQLKRIGPWKSTSVCEKYIQESLTYKRKLGELITGAIKIPATTSSRSVSSATVVSNSAWPEASRRALPTTDTSQSALPVSSKMVHPTTMSRNKLPTVVASRNSLHTTVTSKSALPATVTSKLPAAVTTKSAMPIASRRSPSNIAILKKAIPATASASTGIYDFPQSTSFVDTDETDSNVDTFLMDNSSEVVESDGNSYDSGDIPQVTKSINTIGNTVQKLGKMISGANNLPILSETISKEESPNFGGLTQTMNSIGINIPPNKNNIVFHFGAACSNVTIINMK